MASVAVKEQLRTLFAAEEHFTRWVENPSSSLIHHDSACCEEARLWFLAYARSMEIGTLNQFRIKAPTWLSQLFDWGPTQWPISWCEVMKEKVIDCGVFAALAREVFQAQGHQAHPAQALLSYNAHCTSHWKELWKSREEAKPEPKDFLQNIIPFSKSKEVFPWIGKEVVYHEICLIELPNGQAKVYDSTWGSWYLPQSRTGYGALLALRTECPRLLQWGDKTISCGEWIEL